MELPERPPINASPSRIHRILSVEENKTESVIDLKVITVVNHLNLQNSTDSYDINALTDNLIDDMGLQTLATLTDTLSKDEHRSKAIDTGEFRMDWHKACNGVSHELWPKLASSVRAIINDKNRSIDQFDLSAESAYVCI